MGSSQYPQTSPKRTKYLGIFILIIVILIVIALFFAFKIYSCSWKRNKDNKESPSVITSTLIGEKGRLGNQLFQAAAVIGAAKKNNCKYTFDSSIENTDLFQLTSDNTQLKNEGKVKPNLTIVEKEGVYNSLKVPTDGRVYNLDGYFQSHLYFNGVEDELRAAFKPKDKWIKEAMKQIPQAFTDNSIGLHIRRGDYITHPEHKTMYSHPGANYYYNATKSIIKRLRDKGNNNKLYIIICSDDVEWCKKNLSSLLQNIDNTELIFTKSGNSQYVDFSILYGCHNQVMANSSFSWWSAYLKPVTDDNGVIERHIIAPYPWYQPTGKLWHVQTDNLYYPDWHIMEIEKGEERTKTDISSLKKLYDQRISTENPKFDGRENNKKIFGIDKFYVVNMDSQKERWDSAKSLLNKMGIDPIRYPAVDKKVIASLGGRDGLKRLGLIDKDDSDLDSEGTIGCGLSHRTIWSSIADKEDNTCICIFEDDITSYINKEDLIERLNTAWENIDPDWDVLYLGRCIDSCEDAIKIKDGLYKSLRPYCNHAYIVSARGARKLLTRPLYTGVDTQQVREIEIGAAKAYSFHPSIFIQDILKWNSNLRNFKMQISNACDCNKT